MMAGGTRLEVLARQFLRYMSAGAVATLVHYALLVVLVEAGLAGPAPAALAGYGAGALVAYLLNRRFTFVSGRGHAVAGLRFGLVAALGFGVTWGLMRLLADGLQLHYLLAQAITTGVVLCIGFLANRFWTFSDHRAG